MDLTQNKLTKAEWKSIEIPVSDAEKSILALIEAGYQNLDIKYNEHSSILSSMKITYSKEIEKYIYIKYFKKEISDMVSNSSFPFDDMVENTIKTPKKADLLRINNMDHTLNNIRHRIFEYNQLDFCKELLKKKIPFYLYTLIQMKKSTISNVNKYVSDFIDKLIDFFEKNTSNIIQDIFHNLYDIIEKNTNILKYEDNALYEHQKQLFQVFKHSQDLKTLVLYTSARGKLHYTLVFLDRGKLSVLSDYLLEIGLFSFVLQDILDYNWPSPQFQCRSVLHLRLDVNRQMIYAFITTRRLNLLRIKNQDLLPKLIIVMVQKFK